MVGLATAACLRVAMVRNDREEVGDYRLDGAWFVVFHCRWAEALGARRKHRGYDDCCFVPQVLSDVVDVAKDTQMEP